MAQYNDQTSYPLKPTPTVSDTTHIVNEADGARPNNTVTLGAIADAAAADNRNLQSMQKASTNGRTWIKSQAAGLVEYYGLESTDGSVSILLDAGRDTLDVTATPASIGADAAGTASSAITTHETTYDHASFGDVDGPAGGVADGELASYSGTTGKALKSSSGLTALQVSSHVGVTSGDPHGARAGHETAYNHSAYETHLSTLDIHRSLNTNQHGAITAATAATSVNRFATMDDIAATTGDVTGPSGGVVDGEIASYSGTTGKTIQSSTGLLAANVAAHLASTSNPHSVTAAQVGADPTGTASAAVSAHEAAFSHSSYTSHLEIVSGDPHGSRAAHEAAYDHTAFGDVSGTAVSTVNDEIASYSGTTGKSVKASSGLTASSVSTHLSANNNPHSVTAAQVGADPSGSASAVQTNLTTHENDASNPHSVTAVQVGADPSGSAATVQSNLDAHAANTSLHIGLPPSTVDGKAYVMVNGAWVDITTLSLTWDKVQTFTNNP